MSDGQEKNGLRPHWKSLAACSLISMSAFQYGVDFTLIGGFQAMVGFLKVCITSWVQVYRINCLLDDSSNFDCFVKVFGEPSPKTSIGWNISSERQQLISSLMTLGAFVGSCSAGAMDSQVMTDRELTNWTIAGPIATYIGRKSSLYLAVLLIYVANVVMMTTDSIGGLYAGRLIIGLGNGFLMTFSQLYIQVSEQSSIIPRRGQHDKDKFQDTNIHFRSVPLPAIVVSC